MDDSLVIYQTVNEYEVWFGVDGDNIINAHIIGIGATRDAAVANAVLSLESALEALQSPPGVVREVKLPTQAAYRPSC